jgi:hypothetical protein
MHAFALFLTNYRFDSLAVCCTGVQDHLSLHLVSPPDKVQFCIWAPGF